MGQSSASKLEERYFLQKVKLGEGAFGIVWRAVDRKNNGTVAIKQMDKQKIQKRGARRQDIEREISMLKACDHENITRLYDTFEDARHFYMALEYCDGGDFGDKVREKGMGLTENEARDWMHQVISAVACLHVQRICHRDIKPDNFMVSQECLKLSDFGLAVRLPQGQVLTEKCGSPAFMAPEQHNLPDKSRNYGLPVDVWATGVLMCMVLSGGRHPFVTKGNRLDMPRLLRGEMNFTTEPSGLFASFRASQNDTRFSETARQLCRLMVFPKIIERLTAESALQHPWFESYGASGVALEAPLPVMRSQSLTKKDAASSVKDSAPSKTMQLRGAAGQKLCNEALSETSASDSKAQSTKTSPNKADSEGVGKTMMAAADRMLDGLTTARTVAVGAVVAAPRSISDAFDEVKNAVYAPNPFVARQKHFTPGAGSQSKEAERELLEMGFTAHEVADALKQHRTVNEAAVYILDHRAALLTELVTVGFSSSHAAEAIKHCTTLNACIEWICAEVGGDPRTLQRTEEIRTTL